MEDLVVTITVPARQVARLQAMIARMTAERLNALESPKLAEPAPTVEAFVARACEDKLAEWIQRDVQREVEALHSQMDTLSDEDRSAVLALVQTQLKKAAKTKDGGSR
jgi:hypothetical protein